MSFSLTVDAKRQWRETKKILRENQFQTKKSVLSHSISQMSVKHKDIFGQARLKLLVELLHQNERVNEDKKDIKNIGSNSKQGQKEAPWR